MNDERSQFLRGYQAGVMQAYREVNSWSNARLQRLESKASRYEAELARTSLLRLLRYYLPVQHFPEVWK